MKTFFFVSSSVFFVVVTITHTIEVTYIHLTNNINNNYDNKLKKKKRSKGGDGNNNEWRSSKKIEIDWPYWRRNHQLFIYHILIINSNVMHFSYVFYVCARVSI